MENNYTTNLIAIYSTDLISFNSIKHARRAGQYTEILIWGETHYRQIHDMNKEVWNRIYNNKDTIK